MMKTMLRDKDTTLRLVNELIKLNGFNDWLSFCRVDQIVHLHDTRLEITYVSVKCKPLQRGMIVKSSSFYILMKPGGVHG